MRNVIAFGPQTQPEPKAQGGQTFGHLPGGRYLRVAVFAREFRGRPTGDLLYSAFEEVFDVSSDPSLRGALFNVGALTGCVARHEWGVEVLWPILTPLPWDQIGVVVAEVGKHIAEKLGDEIESMIVAEAVRLGIAAISSEFKTVKAHLAASPSTNTKVDVERIVVENISKS